MNKSKLKRILKEVKREIIKIKELPDDALQNKTIEFKQRLASGESLNSLLPEAYATVCEADERLLGMMPFDVQIMGAIALHYCELAEMNTGEGKTLTATMPLYLNALTGKSTILVTANNYLAERDAKEMGPVYEFLGLSVCARSQKEDNNENLDNSSSNDNLKKIYNTDIVYTTHSTLGFDYLLNNLVTRAEDRYLREFNYVIIDEADMVLMDAAQMPLVISGAPRVQSNLYRICDFFVTTLQKNRDYIVKDKSVWLTDNGVAYAEQFFKINGFYEKENFEINRHVTLALRAHTLLKKNKDYVVTEKGEVSLLDNSTGRVLGGMKLSGGIHQALEEKEKVKLTNETRALASITYQNLFLMFPRMAGMSGTISDGREELRSIYKKHVTVIPPNKPLIRIDKEDLFFNSSKEQFDAAINEVIRIHSTGQPVLVVTSTIKETEYVSRVLVDKKIGHNVLNANSAYWEAQIIKEAGQINNVTVSTGMAGRGTDIKLSPEVAELGGLAVVGVGRMANIRLERQAKGRSGRQGDPGTSQFFVSLYDELVKKIYKKKIKKLKKKNKKLGKGALKRMINGAQKLQEENAVSQRQSSFDTDKVVLRQRDIIYDVRNRLIDGENIDVSLIDKLIDDNVEAYIKSIKKIEYKDVNRYLLDNISFSVEDISKSISNMNKKEQIVSLQNYAKNVWKNKQNIFESQDTMNEFIRRCCLTSIDTAWAEQMDYLEQLSSVISGRATAQKNILFEYHKEAYKSFEKMKNTIKIDIMRNVMLGDYSFNEKEEMELLLP